ncbi:hypothetical protein ACFV97_03400 [Streptomyces sp. NPDC059913]|uniref:hypothetical protein n=1 Tax=unclassified Streptomyces TaxID=2593676 RepID=UPI00364C45E9
MTRTAALARTAAVTGIALAGLLFGAATASAAPAPGDATGRPEAAQGTARACESVEAALAGLPVSVPVPVCKLVNGWD